MGSVPFGVPPPQHSCWEAHGLRTLRGTLAVAFIYSSSVTRPMSSAPFGVPPPQHSCWEAHGLRTLRGTTAPAFVLGGPWAPCPSGHTCRCIYSSSVTRPMGSVPPSGYHRPSIRAGRPMGSASFGAHLPLHLRYTSSSPACFFNEVKTE